MKRKKPKSDVLLRYLGIKKPNMSWAYCSGQQVRLAGEQMLQFIFECFDVRAFGALLIAVF